MEWCFGSGFDDLVVPKDQELSETYPSSDSWSNWGMTSYGVPLAPEKSFVMDGYLTPSLRFLGSYNETETEMLVHEHSNNLRSCAGISDRSSLRETSRPDCKLHNFNGIEQMDDIYLNSLLEDLPGNRNYHDSFSPESESGLKPPDSVFQDISLDSQSFSSSNNNMDCSTYLRAHEAFSPSVALDNGEFSMSPFIHCNPSQVESMPSKGSPSVTIAEPSEDDSSNINLSGEPSFEESVLQDFQTVMAKLTDKTRISFRDTFYRLAKNSEQKSMSPRTIAESTVGTPPTWVNQDKESRSRRSKASESETDTNIIDRAIANLTFNKMDSNVRDRPLTASGNCNRSVSRTLVQQNNRFYQQQAYHLPQPLDSPSVGEVPVLYQRNIRQQV